jgi:hypothetical protein
VSEAEVTALGTTYTTPPEVARLITAADRVVTF